MTCETHIPLNDPRLDDKPVTIGGMLDPLRANVCAVCGLLYVDLLVMARWRGRMKEIAEKQAQREADGTDHPVVTSLRKRLSRSDTDEIEGDDEP